MDSILKNPMTIWLKWFLTTRRLVRANRAKSLKVGYLSNIFNVEFGMYNTIYDHVDIANSVLGDYVYITSNTSIANTQIGNFCSIGPNVVIGLPMHPTNYVSTFPAFFSTRKQCQVTFVEANSFEERGNVRVGNDVWIGANALIMDNISIGDGAIVGAGAVVTKDVPPYAIVGGVPAKVIKFRFAQDQIDKLLTSEWWSRDINWIKQHSSLFSSANISLETVNDL